jgi:hypothetical protein
VRECDFRNIAFTPQKACQWSRLCVSSGSDVPPCMTTVRAGLGLCASIAAAGGGWDCTTVSDPGCHPSASPPTVATAGTPLLREAFCRWPPLEGLTGRWPLPAGGMAPLAELWLWGSTSLLHITRGLNSLIYKCPRITVCGTHTSGISRAQVLCILSFEYVI